MTLMEAAQKWGLSPNWVRELVKSGKVRAVLREDVPVPYYEIPNNEKPPQRRRKKAIMPTKANPPRVRAVKPKAKKK